MRTAADLPQIMLWAITAFFSILIHELGHAYMGRKYGAIPTIHLHGLGGLTVLPGAKFSRKQHIAVTAAGPAASFALGYATLVFTWVIEPATPAGFLLTKFLLWINFFWTFINLLPVLPLDGGQITRDLLGPDRREITRWIGVIFAAAVAGWAFWVGQPFLGIMLAYLAFLNYQQQNTTLPH